AESGVEAAQFLEREGCHRLLAVGGARESGVVEAHEMSVGGEVEIGLEMVGSGLQARTEGEHGVLRLQDAAAAMGDDLAVAAGMGKRHGPSLRKIASYGCRHPNEKEGPER